MTAGNAIELDKKVKLNPSVEEKWGGYVLDGVIDKDRFEVDIEFTI